jgi:hypothetical protein
MAAFTDIAPYVDTHGVEPVGDGDWIFVVSGDSLRTGRRCQGVRYESGPFADACRAAYRAARRQGWDPDSITLTLRP